MADHIDLIPRGAKQARSVDVRVILAVVWGVAIAGGGGWYWMKKSEVAAKEASVAELTSLSRQLTIRLAESTVQSRATDGESRKLAGARKAIESRITWTEAFKELSLLMPKGVWLSSFYAHANAAKQPVIELVGEAPSQAKVAEFLAALESSVFFSRTLIHSSEKLQEISPNLYRFTFATEPPAAAAKASAPAGPVALTGAVHAASAANVATARNTANEMSAVVKGENAKP